MSADYLPEPLRNAFQDTNWSAFEADPWGLLRETLPTITREELESIIIFCLETFPSEEWKAVQNFLFNAVSRSDNDWVGLFDEEFPRRRLFAAVLKICFDGRHLQERLSALEILDRVRWREGVVQCLLLNVNRVAREDPLLMWRMLMCLGAVPFEIGLEILNTGHFISRVELAKIIDKTDSRLWPIVVRDPSSLVQQVVEERLGEPEDDPLCIGLDGISSYAINYLGFVSFGKSTYSLELLNWLFPFYEYSLKLRHNSMKPVPSPCPCCGFYTVANSLGAGGYCDVCGWCDYLAESIYPDASHFADGRTLRVHQQNWLQQAQGTPSTIRRDAGWYPLGTAKRVGVTKPPSFSALEPKLKDCYYWRTKEVRGWSE
jgi:hypothetical protein